MEASHSSPLMVTCPPTVENGTWTCSARRPLPKCSLFCPSGLVPARASEVDCETYSQLDDDFACVPSGVVIVGGLDEEDESVTEVEVFPPNSTPPNHFVVDRPFFELNTTTLVGATTDWYNGALVTCGGIYQMSCSSYLSNDLGGDF